MSRKKAAPAVQAKPWTPSGKSFDERVRTLVRATYDAAQTTNRNENLWATATGRSADSEASPAVRATIRNRCRYEARNNSYCRGMLDTRANDTIGKSPRLELLIDNFDAAGAAEFFFQEWAKEIRLGEKLRLAMLQRGESGEAFLEIIGNQSLRSPIKLDVQLIEADRITGQMGGYVNPLYCDGILYDMNGNPVSYDVLDYHPGSGVTPLTGFGSYRQVPAARMLHFYRATRPGQRRGVPDIAPALNLFGMIRRYSMAVLTAAESAAAVAWALVSQSPDVPSVPVDPEQVIDLVAGAGLTMPAGWKMEQIKAEHPTTTHSEYIRQLINEAARCLQMPLNVAMADSSRYNYASGRLDHQVYHRSIEIDRYDLGVTVLSPLFREWAREYRMANLGTIDETTAHEWYFDGFEHVDPGKEANADDTRLKNGTLTYRAYFSRRGQDWRTAFDQRAEEQSYAKKKGIQLQAEPKPAAPPPGGGKPADGDEDEDEDEDDEETTPPNSGQ